MFKNVYDWIDERLDITPIWRDVADHEVPEHVNPYTERIGNLSLTILEKERDDWSPLLYNCTRHLSLDTAKQPE